MSGIYLKKKEYFYFFYEDIFKKGVYLKGGVKEKFDLKELGVLAPKFWKILLKSFEKKSLMGCSIKVSNSL